MSAYGGILCLTGRVVEADIGLRGGSDAVGRMGGWADVALPFLVFVALGFALFETFVEPFYNPSDSRPIASRSVIWAAVNANSSTSAYRFRAPQ